MNPVLLILLLFVPLAGSAEIYRWVDKDGQLHFSDQKPPNLSTVEEVTISNPNVVSPPGSSASGSVGSKTPNRAATAATAPPRYKNLVLVSPGNDEAIRANSGQVSVNCSLEPALGTKAGHQITVVIDGRRITGLTSCGTTLRQLDRGTHTIHVEVVDSLGKLLISSPKHTFHILRTSRL
jgi:hypothetical protein